mmetsp:Transcript_15507/g.41664  ORF Transcript_15507/g.41664 Transcript_15507/m.41664 type:complete len:202 (-) Transcript_15507:1395-2000(-)
MYAHPASSAITASEPTTIPAMAPPLSEDEDAELSNRGAAQYAYPLESITQGDSTSLIAPPSSIAASMEPSLSAASNASNVMAAITSSVRTRTSVSISVCAGFPRRSAVCAFRVALVSAYNGAVPQLGTATFNSPRTDAIPSVIRDMRVSSEHAPSEKRSMAYMSTQPDGGGGSSTSGTDRMKRKRSTSCSSNPFTTPRVDV